MATLAKMFNLGFLSNVCIFQGRFPRSDGFDIFPGRFFKFCGKISGLNTPITPPSTDYLYMSDMFPLYSFSFIQLSVEIHKKVKTERLINR